MSTAPSLYRRHRPRTFADVVGQEHVVRTLRNAVTQDKLHHAYLFVGSRGTGKTSMAKILASCLNCVNGPTVEPCGVCESCLAIQNAQSMDVIEMDAASNNSVDDIRELRESVSFAPVSGKYKVYILDEAHMLTTAAWNAFLKTLEEPPPSTIFVLATTEANKVLPTVVDRCHRFDFTRPTVEQLAAVLQRVAGREAIDVPPDAVALLARHATGSFRDALGTLEQLVTYAGGPADGTPGTAIAVDDVLAVLGVADADLLFGALDAIAAHDARAALHAAAALAHTGRDVSQFVRDLEGHARELMLVQLLGSVPAEIAVTPDRDTRLAQQAERVAAPDVVRLIDLLAAALRAMKDGADARTQLELALVKAAAPEVDPSSRALLARLERVERAVEARPVTAVPVPVAPTPAPAPPTPAPSLPPMPQAQAAPAPAAPQAAPAATPPTPAAPPSQVAPSPSTAPSPAPAPQVTPSAPPQAPTGSAPSPAPAAPPQAQAAPVPTAGTVPATPAPPAAVAPPTPPAPVAPAPPAAAAPPPAPAAAAPPPAPVASTATAVLTPRDLREVWPAICDQLAESSNQLAMTLRDARPIAVAGREVTVAFDQSHAFQSKIAADADNRELLGEAIRAVTGLAAYPTVELHDLAELDVEAGEPAAAPPSPDEWVDRLKHEFDAEEIVPDQDG